MSLACDDDDDDSFEEEMIRSIVRDIENLIFEEEDDYEALAMPLCGTLSQIETQMPSLAEHFEC
jgi:hypothetical protein